jgi:thymidylate synthase (FAD)
MRSVEPEVFLVARPRLDYDQIAAYLREVGGESWLERLDRGDLDNDAQNLADIPFWFPDWAQEDAELMKRASALLEQMEQFQHWMAGHFGLDDEGVKFGEKKHKTSFMRRFAPDGVATGLVWTANIRTLRHTIEARTDQGAEEEIRLVFGKIGELMRAEAPALFGDYTVTDGMWVPRWRKV